MEARMGNPANVLPHAKDAIHGLFKAIGQGGVADSTLELVHLRTSQINGCSACVDASAKAAKNAGATVEQLASTAAWRDTPYFSDAERAALALTEAATRLADRSDQVPDEIWAEAAKHYDESGLAALVMQIALINFFNRLNITTRQQAGRAW